MVDRLAVTLNILWIAPEAPGQQPLQWLAELGAIGELNGAIMTPIVGPAASVLGISNALSQQGTDVVIWSGHGMANGLLTSDGTILSGQWIATQIQGGMPKVFLIGACSSGEESEFIKSITQQVSEIGVHAIGFTAAVDDKAAAVYAVEFIRAMLAGVEINWAHDVARKEAARISKSTAAAIIFLPALMSGLAPLLSSMKQIGDTVRTLEKRMTALEINLIELMAQMKMLPATLRTVVREIKK